MAIGTGLRLGEMSGLNVGDVYGPHGTPETGIRIRRATATRGLFVAQRLARHASPPTSTIHTRPSDDEMCAKLRGLGC